MSDWKEIELSEILEIEMGQSPKGEFCNTNGGGIPLLNGPTEFGVKSPFPVQFTTRANKVSKENDILFCVRGSTTGRMNWADQEYAIGRGIAAIRHKLGIKYNGFARAIMDHKLPELLSQATGSTFPNISKSQIENVKVKVPQQREQLAVSHFLNTVDAKLNLLYLQNLTLEQLSQTLFKRWFVDFEFPNEEGKPYKSSGGKMVASELGEIPEGWEVEDFSYFIEHSTASINPGAFPAENFFHYSIPAFDNGAVPTMDIGETILSNKYVVKENSILVSKLNPSTPRIWPVFEVAENSVCSTEIQVFEPHSGFYSYVYGLLHSRSIKKEMIQRASGTSSSHQRVRPYDILNIESVVPPLDLIKEFEAIVLPLLKKTDRNKLKIETLTEVRNTLLPKLMSGKIKINYNS